LLQLIRSNHFHRKQRAANWIKEVSVAAESSMTSSPHPEKPVPENDRADAIARMREPPGRLGYIVRRLKRSAPLPSALTQPENRAEARRE
jgi:hypothetical protein